MCNATTDILGSFLSKTAIHCLKQTDQSDCKADEACGVTLCNSHMCVFIWESLYTHLGFLDLLMYGFWLTPQKHAHLYVLLYGYVVVVCKHGGGSPPGAIHR